MSAISILYVEDNFENRMLVRRILMAEDFDVIEAENAFQALDIVKETHPDLILVDINMPEMDGYTLTTRLKDIPELDSVPIVALTANVMKGDRERILGAGCDGYIQKPIDFDELLREIEKFLARSANA